MSIETLSQGGSTLFCGDGFYFHSSVLCVCIGFFSVCACDSLCFSLSHLFSSFPQPPSVSLRLTVSSLTLWPLCETGDDLVFGDVVHANDLSVKAAYSNMTA